MHLCMSFICVPFLLAGLDIEAPSQPLDFWSDYPRLAALPPLPDAGQFCSGCVCLCHEVFGMVGWLRLTPMIPCRVLHLEYWSYVHAENNIPTKEVHRKALQRLYGWLIELILLGHFKIRFSKHLIGWKGLRSDFELYCFCSNSQLAVL